ncbi:MAG: hypothetical protein BWX98_02031 [Candidatus Aminicenantes bacterium ADurb.Bin147]|nr:MAG: hypothetical protein BWX98_02031 [Candidatus Aminicenantes bacterium ADurb.Bin147]
MTAVTAAFRTVEKRRRRRKAILSWTKALEAESIMTMGDSTIQASDVATPKAARLILGSAKRAMIAATKGPSTAIISQVAWSGSQ